MKEVYLVSRVEWEDGPGGHTVSCTMWDSPEPVPTWIKMLNPGLARFTKLVKWHFHRTMDRRYIRLGSELVKRPEQETDAEYTTHEELKQAAWRKYVFGYLVEILDPDIATTYGSKRELWECFDYYDGHLYKIEALPVLSAKEIE